MGDCFEKAFYIVSMLVTGFAFGMVVGFIIATSDDKKPNE